MSLVGSAIGFWVDNHSVLIAASDQLREASMNPHRVGVLSCPGGRDMFSLTSGGASITARPSREHQPVGSAEVPFRSTRLFPLSRRFDGANIALVFLLHASKLCVDSLLYAR